MKHLLARLEIKSFTSRDEQEVAGCSEAKEPIFYVWSDIPITENHISQLHRGLLLYSEKDERHRGEYKMLSNNVGAFDETGKMIGIVFETASPFDTPKRMAELIGWLNDARELKRLHPLLKKFERPAHMTPHFFKKNPVSDQPGRVEKEHAVLT